MKTIIYLGKKNPKKIEQGGLSFIPKVPQEVSDELFASIMEFQSGIFRDITPEKVIIEEAKVDIPKVIKKKKIKQKEIK
jgi:hypothetical protein